MKNVLITDICIKPHNFHSPLTLGPIRNVVSSHFKCISDV